MREGARTVARRPEPSTTRSASALARCRRVRLCVVAPSAERKTKRLTPARSAAPTIRQVATPLSSSIEPPAWSRGEPARWMTESTPRIALRNDGGSARSPRAIWTRTRSAPSSRGSRTRQRTGRPSATSRRSSAVPTVPEAPVSNSMARARLRARAGRRLARRELQRRAVVLGRRISRDPRRRVGVVLVERLALEQRVGQRVEVLAPLGEQHRHVVVGVVDEPADLLVDELLRRLRRLGRSRQQRALVVGGQHGDGPDALAHPPAADHAPGDGGELLDVGLRAGGDLAEDELLGDAPAERDLDLAPQVRLVVGELVARRR